MSDISLLFDVAGGGSLSGESGKVISEQLSAIVNSINANPLKIKFQADSSSLDDMRTEINKIAKSVGTIKVPTSTTVSKSATDGLKSVNSVTKTIGEDTDLATNKIQKLLNKLDVLSRKAEESNAKIKHSTVYEESGRIVSRQDDVGAEEELYAAEAVDRLREAVQRYEDTITPDTEQKQFNTDMAKFSAEADSIKFAIDEDAAALKNLQKSERENLKDTNALSKAIVSTNRAYKQATEAVQKYTAAKNGKSAKEYLELEKDAAELKVLNDRLDAGTVSEQEYVKETNRLRASIQQCTAIIKANGEAHLSLGDKIKVTAEKFSQYFTVAKFVQAAWRAVNKMVDAAIELDDAFTQLKIVTGATDEEMAKFSNTAVTLAKNLGQSVAGVTNSIETFSRLGYSLEEASSLAEYATILANTASVTTDEATTGLTSIVKGFNMDVSDAEHVADVLIEVGQKYAVSASEMMEAYERSGAALSATNTSFEKSAGLIAAANASVQDSSVVGTALKTVSARIRGSKSDLEELGEDTEELAEGFSKYADEIKALTGFNIMVEGSTTEFKDLYDIMEGVAQVWDNLSGTSQSRVAEILGGTRQLQVISSIIGNWGDAAGAYEAAINSAGVATKANDTYMESITAHINQFKASFEELSSDILSSDLVNVVVDFGTALLNVVDGASKLTSALGTIPSLAVAISTALSFKNVGELIKQFQFLIILRIEYAHEAFD